MKERRDREREEKKSYPHILFKVNQSQWHVGVPPRGPHASKPVATIITTTPSRRQLFFPSLFFFICMNLCLRHDFF